LKILTNNLWLKLFSLGVAVALAAYVYLYIDYQITEPIRLPLVVKGLNAELLITSPLPQRVQVKLRGPYRSVQQISRARLSASLDCSTFKEPGHVAARVQLPNFGDVVVADQDYDFIEIDLEPKADKELPIIVERRGEIAADLQISDEKLSTHMVEIVGPRRLVDRVKRAVVQPDVSGLEQEKRVRVPVRVLDESDQAVQETSLTLQPEVVEYSIKVLPQGAVRVLKVIPDLVGQPDHEFLLGEPLPRPLYVTVDSRLVTGDQRYIRTEAINLEGARASFTKQVQLQYPFVVPAGSDLPQTCDVYIEIVPLEQREEAAARVVIRLVGNDPAYEYVLTPSEIIVRAEEMLEAGDETRGALRATVDVAGLAPGEYRLVPQVALPLQLDSVTIIPASIKVTIIHVGN